MDRRTFIKTVGILSLISFIPLNLINIGLSETKKKLLKVAYVGDNQQFKTVNEAMNNIAPNGIIYVMPHKSGETLPVIVDKPITIVGIQNHHNRSLMTLHNQ